MNLKEIPIFADLTEEAISKVQRIIKEAFYEKETVIFLEGTPGNALYVIELGTVKITKTIDKKMGREKLLATLSGGEFFGELALLDERPRSATATALPRTKLLTISRQDFNELLDSDHQIAAALLFQMLKVCADRLRQTDSELVALFETGKIIGSVYDLEHLTSLILDRIMEATEATKGAFILYNDLLDQWQMEQAKGFEEISLKGSKVNPSAGILGWVLAQGKSTIVDNWSEDTRFNVQTRQPYEPASMLCVPLVAREKVIGIIILGNKMTGEPFTKGNENLLNAVGSQVAIAIENAKHREEEAAKGQLQRVYIPPI